MTLSFFHSSCFITTRHRHYKSRLSENPVPWRVINLGAALLESMCRGNWRAASYSLPIWIHHQSQKNKCTEGKFQGCSSGGHSPPAISCSLSPTGLGERSHFVFFLISSASSSLENKRKCRKAFITLHIFRSKAHLLKVSHKACSWANCLRQVPPFTRHTELYSTLPLGLKGIYPWQLQR